MYCFFFFQAEDGIRDLVRSRGLGDVYKRQDFTGVGDIVCVEFAKRPAFLSVDTTTVTVTDMQLSLIHI